VFFLNMNIFDNKRFEIIPHQKLVNLSYFTFVTGAEKLGGFNTMKRDHSVQDSLFVLLRSGSSTGRIRICGCWKIRLDADRRDRHGSTQDSPKTWQKNNASLCTISPIFTLTLLGKSIARLYDNKSEVIWVILY